MALRGLQEGLWVWSLGGGVDEAWTGDKGGDRLMQGSFGVLGPFGTALIMGWWEYKGFGGGHVLSLMMMLVT